MTIPAEEPPTRASTGPGLRLLYTTEEAPAMLAVSPSFLRRAATADALPHTRVGRFVRWSKEDHAKIVERGRREPIAPPRRGRRS